MGEQAQTQTQTQTMAQPQHSPAAADSQPLMISTELATAPPPPPPPQNPTPSSKLPFRPRKIRKLSPDAESPQTDPAGEQAPNAKTKIVPAPRILARPLTCEGEIEVSLRHLRSADPVLARLFDLYQPPSFDSFRTPFLALSRSILYQQLAYKAGTSIYTRFVALCGGEAGVVPEVVLALTPPQLRQIGISARKASYLHDLARKYQNGILSDSSIVEMDDRSLFTMLTMVNGIGSWSVHMFMIFTLHRPDVLPVGDLNIRKGVQLLFGLEELPRPSQMEQWCEKWRPYRSVASWYLWRFIEAKGVPSTAGSLHHQHQHQHQEEQHQHQQQQQPQPQLLDPINSILNLGACGWGQ